MCLFYYYDPYDLHKELKHWMKKYWQVPITHTDDIKAIDETKFDEIMARMHQKSASKKNNEIKVASKNVYKQSHQKKCK